MRPWSGEMSLVNSLGIIMVFLGLLFYVCLVSAAQKDTKDESQRSVIVRWFSHIVSRGVYFLLAILIAVCFIITTIKKKVEDSRRTIFGEENSWAPSILKGNSSFVLKGSSSTLKQYPMVTGDDDVQSVRDKLREAETSMGALRAELELANKTRIQLENTLESIERDKCVSEDQLIRVKMEGALQVENLKKESLSVERQLQNAIREKDELCRQVEVLKRETRISDSALRDQQSLTERLESARIEIFALKQQMHDMKVERDTAVRLSSELMERAKGAVTRNVQNRQLFEEMIDSEIKRAREEANGAERNSSLLCQFRNETVECDPKGKMDKMVLGDAQNTASLCICLPSFEGDEFRTDSTLSLVDQFSADDDDKSRIVTNSPAFRAFLDNIFPRRS